MNSPPFASIIVPAFNAESHIQDCLFSLMQMDYPPERREILVVDNGSTDNTAQLIKKFPVQYLYESNRGVSAARNKAIQSSSGEILAFTDSDCLVSKSWLSRIVSSFHDAAVGGVAGEIVAHIPITPAERYAARVRHLSPQKYLLRPHLPFAVFANLAFRKEIFERIGLLDENFKCAGESTDFCTRFFRQTGKQLKFIPEALVFHRHRKSVWSFCKQQWNYGRSHALLCRKYGELSWTWRHSMLANRDLLNSAWSLVKSSTQRKKEDTDFYYFEFLKKSSERLGFIRENLFGRKSIFKNAGQPRAIQSYE